MLTACKTGSVCSVNKPTGTILACFFVCKLGLKCCRDLRFYSEKEIAVSASVFFESNVLSFVFVWFFFAYVS